MPIVKYTAKLDVYSLILASINIPTLCMSAMNVLCSLSMCADLPENSLMRQVPIYLKLVHRMAEMATRELASVSRKVVMSLYLKHLSTSSSA